jgi:hypothetical protein
MVKVIKKFLSAYLLLINTTNLFAACRPTLKGHGSIIFSLSIDNPLPLCLERTLGQGDDRQHPLQHRGEPLVHLRKARRVEEVEKQLEGFFCPGAASLSSHCHTCTSILQTPLSGLFWQRAFTNLFEANSPVCVMLGGIRGDSISHADRSWSSSSSHKLILFSLTYPYTTFVNKFVCLPDTFTVSQKAFKKSCVLASWHRL